MDIFNVVAGVITILAFVFSIFVYIRGKKKQREEEINHDKLLERMNTINEYIDGLVYSSDSIVQIAGQENTTTKELQNIARNLRYQISITKDVLNNSQKGMREWRFGKALTLNPIDNKVGEINASDNR